MLALPLMRGLAAALAVAWLLISTPAHPGWAVLETLVVLFVLYSAGLVFALWRWPRRTFGYNLPVLAVDLGFTLTLIAVSGDAGSALYLGLLLIAALQSYYHGLRRGLLAAAAAAGGYLSVLAVSATAHDWGNVAMRLAGMLGTAVGVGILAGLEAGERLKVSTLTTEAEERERYIRNVVESLQEGVAALDATGRVTTWNAAMERCCGALAREAIGRDFFTVLPESSRAPWTDALRQLRRGEIESFSFEGIEHLAPGLGARILNLKGNLLRQGGHPAGAVLLVQDITERVNLERSARQAEKLAGLGTLAAGVAHELNNPIGVISSRVELMLLDAESRPLPEDVYEDLQVVHRNAQRVTRIAQGLLSFARHSPRARGSVDLNIVVEDTLLLVEKAIAKEGIVVRRALAPRLPVIVGDANALQQVIVNLLTNARDALNGHGEIAVETAAAETAGGGVRLVVRDTGPGIAPEMLSRIFDPFFTTKREGTGLGLSITYGIVRDHHGTVDVDSVPGRGTSFVLTFPAAAARTAA